MNVLNITGDYVSEDNTFQFTDDENDSFNLFLKLLILSISSCVLLLYPISLILWTTLKPLFSYQLNIG